VCCKSINDAISPISFGLSTNKGTPVFVPGSTIVVGRSEKYVAIIVRSSRSVAGTVEQIESPEMVYPCTRALI
jgi:hypothetical protein